MKKIVLIISIILLMANISYADKAVWDVSTGAEGYIIHYV